MEQRLKHIEQSLSHMEQRFFHMKQGFLVLSGEELKEKSCFLT